MRIKQKLFIMFSLCVILCFAVLVVATGGDGKTEKPVIFDISDAISPGETLVITGNYFYDNSNLKVAYAKNSGTLQPTFDEENLPQGIKYLDSSYISVKDSVYENGIVFIFPSNEECGIYDFWVNNGNGWSNGITMNAVRAQYIDQEMSYAGLPIQIVGRNFYKSEYGIGTEEESLSSLRVKLVRMGDKDGNEDGITEEVVLSKENGGISTDVKYSESESFTGEVIYDTNPYKITFITPNVTNKGTFEVLVSSDGTSFSSLEENQTLVITDKKEQNWNEDVFGTEYQSHIGNDPLDLKAYWAQDFNYINIRSISPNTDTSSGEIASKTLEIQMAIYDLANNGGGVIYLTQGDYYVNTISLEPNVIIVGDGTDKTRVFNVNKGGILFYSENTKSNIGLARFSILCYGEDIYPDAIISFNDATDVYARSTKNKFLTDVEITSKQKITENNQSQHCTVMLSAKKNQIVQNVKISGGTAISMYTTEYSKIENVWCKNVTKEAAPHLSGKYAIAENFFFDMGNTGHGISVRSRTYCAYGRIINAGNRNPYSNDGEPILAECAGTTLASGNVNSATNRSINVTVTSGGKSMVYGPEGEITHAPDKSTYPLYNNYAVYISKGKGIGQMRYVKLPDSCIGFTATYEFLDGEKDWDVIPDETSTFVIMEPIAKLTVYKIYAQDCNGPICLYFTCTDTLVKDCVLKNTGGVAITTLAFPTNVGMQNGYSGMVSDIRVESNKIEGVTPQYNDGFNNKESGGIIIFCDNQWSERIAEHGVGMVLSNIVIRDNELKNLVATTASELPNLGRAGISIITNGGNNETEGEIQNARYIIIEGNSIDNSEWGIHTQQRVSGLMVRSNDIKGVTLAERDIETNGSCGVVTPQAVTFNMEDGTTKTYDYFVGEKLFEPEEVENDGKTFYGWSLTSAYNADNPLSEILQSKEQNTFYAIFKYNVEFDLNYTIGTGEEAGIWEEKTTSLIQGSALDVSKIVPTREGYNFLGWYNDDNLTEKAEATKTINEKTTLFAKWEEIASDDETPDDSENPDNDNDDKTPDVNPNDNQDSDNANIGNTQNTETNTQTPKTDEKMVEQISKLESDIKKLWISVGILSGVLLVSFSALFVLVLKGKKKQ